LTRKIIKKDDNLMYFIKNLLKSKKYVLTTLDIFYVSIFIPSLITKIIKVNVCTPLYRVLSNPTFSMRRYKTCLKNRHEIGG